MNSLLRKIINKVNNRQLIAELAQLAHKWEPALRDAFLAAIRSARQQTTLQTIANAMQQTDPAAALREGMRGLEFKQMQETLAQIIEAAGNGATQTLSSQIGPKQGRFLADFNITNPYAAQYARTEVGNLVREITHSTQDGIRDLITRSIEEGISPQETAMQIRNQVGLTSQQMNWVANYQNELIASGVANVDERVARYAEKVLRYRALTIARTETIDALNAGKQAAWQAAIDQGWLTGDEQQVWITAPKACEDICSPANGQKVDMGDYFKLGDGSRVLRPPAHPNCKCTISLIA